MKRFIDTNRWKKTWYRRLSPELKCYWSWLTDHCDCAGIIDVDVEVAAFQIGAKSLPDPCNAFPGKVKLIGDKYFIVDFVRFQNGSELNPSNNAHRGILKRLEAIGYDGVPDESTSPSQAPSEPLPRGTGKGKGKGKGKGNSKNDIKLPFESEKFKEAWDHWVAFRKESRKPMPETTIAAQIKKMEAWGEAKSIATIQRSIENGWTGLFPDDKAGTTPTTDVPEGYIKTPSGRIAKFQK